MSEIAWQTRCVRQAQGLRWALSQVFRFFQARLDHGLDILTAFLVLSSECSAFRSKSQGAACFWCIAGSLKQTTCMPQSSRLQPQMPGRGCRSQPRLTFS
ncbi:hypothetical protein JI59_02235 [Novosphingobium pentaromativorans US6-1]|nr:hypothetical protein JI59_02235 [Novosphingobium pentaromativorans US6-1]